MQRHVILAAALGAALISGPWLHAETAKLTPGQRAAAAAAARDKAQDKAQAKLQKQGEAQSKARAKAAKKAKPKTSAKGVVHNHWVCPMHDGGESAKPGKCPKCGMDLVEEPIS